MAASNSLETNKEANWINRLFSSVKETAQRSSASTNRLTSITNPSFESIGDILRIRRTPEHHPRPQPTSIDDSLVEIAVNAGSDTSSLADKSKGTIDFFHTPSVS
ncbi:unnamed protein product [Rotaria sp. Silwood2]|nr:unnamed protein product [Rotaria sp. Silwood2]